MQGGSDGALGDLLSGFSTPARHESRPSKPELDKDIMDLFGPTPISAGTSTPSAGHGGHPPPAQQVQQKAISSKVRYLIQTLDTSHCESLQTLCRMAGSSLRWASMPVTSVRCTAQIPGSRTSSMAYEDAVSRGFTPETTASLLDFDTPFASPTSPMAHQVALFYHLDILQF